MSKGKLIEWLVFSFLPDAESALRLKCDEKFAARLFSRKLHIDGESFYVYVVVVRDSPDRWQHA